MMHVLKALDHALALRTYLVGESITLADMAVAAAVLLPFKYVCVLYNNFLSDRFRHIIPNLVVSLYY